MEALAHGSRELAVTGSGWVASPFTAGRVLAECAAKRKILGNVPLVTDNPAETGGTSEYVLMCLAAVYRKHPDYQEGWWVDDYRAADNMDPPVAQVQEHCTRHSTSASNWAGPSRRRGLAAGV